MSFSSLSVRYTFDEEGKGLPGRAALCGGGRSPHGRGFLQGRVPSRVPQACALPPPERGGCGGPWVRLQQKHSGSLCRSLVRFL